MGRAWLQGHGLQDSGSAAVLSLHSCSCSSQATLPASLLQHGGLFSAEYSFRAAPAPGPNQTVHILTLADQGVGEQRGWVSLRLRVVGVGVL